jgi:uncharacterized RDD family membrane protein YckC
MDPERERGRVPRGGDRRPRSRKAAPKVDDAALGLAVTAARAARTAARLLAHAPGASFLLERSAATGRAALVSGRERIESAAQSALSAPEVERLVDGALASPLPEVLARSTIEHHVGDRVVAEIEPEREKLLEQMLASPEFERALEQVLSSPKVREALTKQTTSLAEEVVADLRTRVVRLDGKSTPFAGFWSRGVAFAVDLVLAQIVFLVLTALVGLIVSLVGSLRPEWLYGAIAGSAWTLLVGGYFVFFWTLGGQTPGMRVLHLRVTEQTGRPLGVARSIVRFVSLLVAIIPLFAGLVPIFFTRRRRGLQDFVAGTVVVYADEEPRPAAAA